MKAELKAEVEKEELQSQRRIETETIINWDRTDEPVSICTCHQPEWKMLEKAGYKAMEIGYESNKVACKTFGIPRNQVKVAIMPNAKPRPHPSFKVSQRGAQKAKVTHWTEKYKHVEENGQVDAGKEA